VTEEERQRIRALFVYLLTLIKGESEAGIRLSAEVASLLSAVHALDPTFEDHMEMRRAQVDKETAPLLNAGLKQFDEAIRKVESGEWI
jgi:hypothetical protein